METFAIYLAGKIQKGHEEPNETFWGDQEIAEIQSCFAPVNVQLLNPIEAPGDVVKDPEGALGRDLMQVFVSDCVFVDARDRRGLGVGIEMCVAKLLAKPVVTLAPKESHYNRSSATVSGHECLDYIHPFVFGFSDKIAHTISEAVDWMKEKHEHIKGKEVIFDSMKYYGKNYFLQDPTFFKFIEENPLLKQRFELVLGQKLETSV
ncbi:MAG: hypothetical protein K940chlam8_00703 [Chlamydiae bacterium]|nr:hypothetical protein [Chlamydiota bacterium]